MSQNLLIRDSGLARSFVHKQIIHLLPLLLLWFCAGEEGFLLHYTARSVALDIPGHKETFVTFGVPGSHGEVLRKPCGVIEIRTQIEILHGKTVS